MKKRMITLLLILLGLMLPVMAVEADAAKLASGSCGDDLTWTMYDSGVLSISGTGDMYDFGGQSTSNPVPWNAYMDQIKTVRIDSDVTRIGNLAFGSCENLTNVTFSPNASLQSIGDQAFCYCTTLKKIGFPDTLQKIGNYAFMSCKALTEITIPASVTELGWQAFYVCENLQTVRFLGDAPVFGGASAHAPFHGLSARAYYPGNNNTWTDAARASFGASLNWMKDYSITIGSDKVTDDKLSGTGWRYTPQTNVLSVQEGFTGNINSRRESLIIQVSGAVECGSIVSSGSLILEGASDKDTDSVTIDYGSVKTESGDLRLEDLALNVENTNTSAVVVGASDGDYGTPTGCFAVQNADVTAWSSGSAAYYGINTGTLEVSGNSYVYGRSSRAGVYGIRAGVAGSSFSANCHVEASATGAAFYIAGVTVPEYAYLYDASVYGGSYRKVKTADVFSSVYSSAQRFEYLGIDHARYQPNEDGKTHSLVCDCGKKNGDSVAHTFDTTTSLCDCGSAGGICGANGSNVAWNFDQTTGTLTISGTGGMQASYNANMSAGRYAPWRDFEVKKVIVEESVTYISDYAFYNEYTITNVTLPTSVTQLGYGCFYNLGITGITLPEALIAIPKECFQNCSKLTGITVPKKVTEIGKSAFSGCLALKSVTLPDGITTIGNAAFHNCQNLSSVELPAQLEKLDSYAFQNCKALKNLTFPKTLKTLNNDAFNGCSNMTLTFQGPAPEDGINNAFYGLTTATVYYPANETSWETAKTQYHGGSGISWTAVYPTEGECGANVYWHFDKKTGKLTISGSGYMDDYQRENTNQSTAPWAIYRDQITTVVVESGVNSVADYGFTDSAVSSVTIADTVTHIGQSAFAYCDALRAISLPEGVQVIGTYAFHDAGLTTLTVPASVRQIAGQAFYGCALTEITFRGGAPYIGDYAFSGARAAVYYPADNNTWTNTNRKNYGGSLTWVPYCAGAHAYGQPVFTWQGNESCTALFSCSVCGENQRVSCTMHVTTVPATENRNGEITYTATAVLGGKKYTDTKMEVIPKEEHVHSFEEAWTSDKTNHWKKCSICGEETDISDHMPGDEATQNTSQKCEVCGYVIRMPLGLDWFSGRMQENKLLPSGFYADIMEQYADAAQ